MLNYISAELYKVRHRTYTYVLLIVLLLGEVLFAWLFGYTLGDYADYVKLLSKTLVAGLFFVIPLSELVFSEQFKFKTLQNEILFGIPRTRIYVGKLCATILMSFAYLAVVLVFYLGLGWLCASHPDPAGARGALVLLANALIAAIPLWLGALGLVQLLYVLIKNEMTAATVFGVALLIGPSVFQFISLLELGMLSDLAGCIYALLPLATVWRTPGILGFDLMLQTWLLGLGCLAITTGLGVIMLIKREF